MIPSPGVHGGDGPAIAKALGIAVDEIVDLSRSVNPFAPDIATIAARHLDSLRHYPTDRDATALLAAAIGVDPARLLLTNGGSEAIALVGEAWGGGVIGEPEFSLHPRDSSGPRWRSNPNNPTGRLAAPDDRADVWDEAFYPLATGAWTRGDTDAVVVGSLTKVFACPGLRLGYVIVDDVHRLAKHRAEWPVNALALAVIPDLLERADLAVWSQRIAAQRESLVTVLDRYGFDVDAADAPWVLVHAPGLRDRLVLHKIVVRDCASFGLAGWFRIAVPDDRGLELLARALLEGDLS